MWFVELQEQPWDWGSRDVISLATVPNNIMATVNMVKYRQVAKPKSVVANLRP